MKLYLTLHETGISCRVETSQLITARKMSKYGVFSGPYFPVFGLNTGKYGPEKTPYLDTFYAVDLLYESVG